RPVEAGPRFVGAVQSSRSSRVGTEFGGLVTEYLAEEGTRVKAGAPLARLRTVLLDLRIRAAKAELALRRAQLLELENGTRPEELAQAKARVGEAVADLELKRWRRVAAEGLYENKTISEDEVRTARLAVRAAESALDVQKNALALAEAGPREERKVQARAQVEQQEVDVARLEEERDRYVIRAPFDGIVTKKLTEVGEWLATGAGVAEIDHFAHVDVVVHVVEDYVSHVRAGMVARVVLGAIPGRIFTGPVREIVPRADARSRTFPVKIRLRNEDLPDGSVLLKDGMFAEATLGVGDESPALLVPKDAIVLGGMVPVLVWIVDDATSTAKMVPVRLGVAVDDLIQVIGPLEAGQKVVVRGNERILFPGQPLRILE
ncbi:MAG: efflux RND transporter periplasmic adaptor subunit, partial [Planctomycetota bacterium]